jgi:hypothetical protein
MQIITEVEISVSAVVGGTVAVTERKRSKHRALWDVDRICSACISCVKRQHSSRLYVTAAYDCHYCEELYQIIGRRKKTVMGYKISRI